MGGRGQNFTIKRNTEVKNVDNTTIVIPKGTKFTNVILIAGGNKKRKVDQADLLSKKYGGKSENWEKYVANATIRGKQAEVHYFQNKKDGIGKVKYKIKRW